MGVKCCSRKECENIMCDTYVNSVGYVCNDCQSEFKGWLGCKDKTDLTEGEIIQYLEKFMDIIKDTYVLGDKIDIDDFFNQHTTYF